MPGLNELLDARSRMGRAGRKRYNKYSAIKRQWAAVILAEAKRQGLSPVGRATFCYEWREASKRRDPSNVSAGGRKLIEDALVIGGYIPGDGWRFVAGFTDQFCVDRERPGVRVTITDEGPDQP